MKLMEVDARIADLTTIRTARAAAVDAECDILTVCAGSGLAGRTVVSDLPVMEPVAKVAGM
ncbi:hypothetical protein ACH41E_29705 [Streptomyces sp. NPDC020412]|uniref:hypothetical protein n=1 Tax=Streptomyces sp. NPDC020412 TaxID=3365073 RepID=UPI0037B47328